MQPTLAPHTRANPQVLHSASKFPEELDVLDKVPLFSCLPFAAIQALESHSSIKSYRKNTVIIEKGDESTSMYVLEEGKVRVYVSDEEGKEVVLNVLEAPGAYFGELALLGDTERTASVMTVEDSKMRIISKQDFIACLGDNPQIALELIHDLVKQVKTLTDRVGTLALNDVYGRVAATLNEWAKEENGRLITGRLTQQEIAQMVGSSREMVSRIFKDLKLGGYIEIESKRIILLKKLPARW
jgi:CRP/FNR family cyclic AMP-dependent transcriptional regulator